MVLLLKQFQPNRHPRSMRVSHLPFDSVPQFSSRDKAYVAEDERLRPFYKYPVAMSSFQRVFSERASFPTDRSLLVQVLKEQYKKLAANERTSKQIERLGDENVFTVVTAHQPALFTGPLYYIYKIASTIHLARKLNEAYPDFHVVPVFISGGEDHDFEEVNHAQIFGNTLTWENDEGGSVGRMSTQSLSNVLEELQQLLGDSENAVALFKRIQNAYTQFDQYGHATQALVHDLFGDQGLVVLGMDDPALKKAFIPYIKQEIFEQPSQGFVQAAQKRLEDLGFSGQAHPREINFFHLGVGYRSRIVEEKGAYQVLNQNISFTREELEQEIEAHPERFSPNVVMRPIYQELILPNLAYIGGGGELAYWLERREQFEHFGIPYPMLIRRNSVIWIDKTSGKRMDKLELSITDLMGEVEQLIKDYVKRNSDEELSFSEQKKALAAIYAQIAQKTQEVDPTLVKTARAEQATAMKGIGSLEGRLVKAEKQKQETAVNQIRKVKEKLFPGNGLQERVDNFIPFYLKHGDAFLQLLINELDPLRKELVLIEE
jgi:bacillithiol biosynthesis cysteine-adding enzyme BshC